jgi:hypothetical protein
MKMKHSQKHWAIVIQYTNEEPFLMGRYYLNAYSNSVCRVDLFETRGAAQKAAKSCFGSARVIRVSVTVEEV